MSLSAFRVAMAIAQLHMDLVMERLMDLDLDEGTGMVALTVTVAGEQGGTELGAMDGDTRPDTHTRLAHHLQCMCSQFWLSPLFWQPKPSPQFGTFVHPLHSISRM
jgi:hypothetical protein